MEKKKILIVEDESITAYELKLRLTKWDYEVIAVVTKGEDAIAFAIEMKPDLILMDIFLDDDIDGIEAAEEILKIVEIPIIYLTASEDSVTYERAMNTKNNGFLTKPYSPNILKKSLHEIFNEE